MFATDVTITTTQIYWWNVLGVVISVVLPILRGLLPRPVSPIMANAATVGFWKALWDHATPYLILGVFSMITGLLIVVFTYGTLNDWRGALLAGYAWDSTLQKLGKP